MLLERPLTLLKGILWGARAIFKAAKAFSDIFYMNVTGTAGAREALEAALAAAAI